MTKRPSQPSGKRGAKPSAGAAPTASIVPSDVQTWAAPAAPTLPVAEWLTVERVLWGVLIALAASMRLLDLARFSLDDSEAMLANAALAVLRGDAEAALRASPFVVGVDTILFGIFGSNDATARVVSAVAGVAPVVLTYRLRDELGRWGALVAGLLFALSPSFLFASRTANGDIVAIASVYAALIAAWTLLRGGSARMLNWMAVGLAIALTSSSLTYTVLLVIASFAVVTILLRRTQQLAAHELDSLAALRNSPGLLRNAALTFAVVFLACATGALLNPLGLQSALSLGAEWFAQWTLPSNQPASYYLQLLFTYELLPFVFGLGGLFYYLSRGERWAPFVALWIGLSLTLHTLAPFKSAEAILVMLVPLILVAGRAIANLLGALVRGVSWVNEGVFLVLGLLTCGIFGVNLADFAQTGQQSHVLVAGLALVMLLFIGALVGGVANWLNVESQERQGKHPSDADSSESKAWRFDLPRALVVVGAVLCIALAT
ncbi:MAG: glycosyltransferase family 39 protein, partial [Chloroflexi bacterium]|nr:glycosyltransferase family 39 protein [Chloroflexota bacterium]